MTELNQLLQRLCDAEIDFVIVGGFAAVLHGSALLTRDLDVCAVLTDNNVAKLRNALRELKPTHRFTEITSSMSLWRYCHDAQFTRNGNPV